MAKNKDPKKAEWNSRLLFQPGDSIFVYTDGAQYDDLTMLCFKVNKPE